METKKINGRRKAKTFCLYCGKEKWKRLSELKAHPNTFCSNKCLAQHKRKNIVIQPCATCGKTVERSPSQVRKSITGNSFCNKSCSATYSNANSISRLGENHPNWKGGTSNYLKTTIQKAQRIEKAECNRCKWNQFVDVLQTHHRDRDRSNNSSSNLEVLCPTCHYSEHYQAHDGIYWNNKIVNMS